MGLVTVQSAPDLVAEPDVVRLPRRSRAVRLAVAGALLALMAVGSAWGTDADFPFGPWKMYSTRADPDQPVVSTRVVALTADGQEVRLSGGQVGLRRAEFEGQEPRIKEHPELLGLLADAYAKAHPDAPALVSVEVVQRWFELHDGLKTGEYYDKVVVDHPLGGDR